MLFKNLTPHPITLFATDGVFKICTFASQGSIRLPEIDERVSKDWIHGHGMSTQERGWTYEQFPADGNTTYQLAIPIVKRRFGVSSLPPAEEGVGYIVSLPTLMSLVASGCQRRDLFAPDTGPGRWGAVRDENGAILGVQRLMTLSDFPEGLWCGDGWSPEEWEAAQTEG